MKNLLFFSSRRRHTISLRDWSSDVCSSDLLPALNTLRILIVLATWKAGAKGREGVTGSGLPGVLQAMQNTRSEERRVGKERRSRSTRYRRKNKNYKKSASMFVLKLTLMCK